MTVSIEKIETAIEKIDRIVRYDGLFGKCDAILKLNPARWNTEERLTLLDRITARCRDAGLRDLMREIYGRSIRGER